MRKKKLVLTLALLQTALVFTSCTANSTTIPADNPTGDVTEQENNNTNQSTPETSTPDSPVVNNPTTDSTDTPVVNDPTTDPTDTPVVNPSDDPTDTPVVNDGTGQGNDSSTPVNKGDIGTVGEISILSSAGHLESASVTWSPVTDATSYNVYYKAQGEADTEYKKISSMLIRKYSNYYRADVLGLKQGSYELKVSAVINDKESEFYSTCKMNVSAHDRSGYAFVDGDANGAYNSDGTLKTNAQVVYVTAANAKTVTATVGGKTITGFQSIIAAKQKANTSSEIINFRIIGEIKDTDLDAMLSSEEGMQIKGANTEQNMNMTIEGVGTDATINGFGFLIRNSANVEMRNLGIINFMDDGISIDTDNKNLWIHNIDFFYGGPGGDSDQAKGDGSLDIKKSHYITISYNHFWDSGKSCLLDAQAGSGSNYLSYHHNWFDHSDSRHPRVRNATNVHVYNNYFDGNSKYGVGATTGSSVYVEGNYFRSCKNPMLSSQQGTDSLGDGTFSNNSGGIIKAFDNFIDNASSLIYANSDSGTTSANSTSFDAYLASSRSETVPNSYVTVNGGTTYSNFDTQDDFYSYLYDSPTTAKTNVENYAGRIDGGDIKFTFNNDVDDTSYDINPALKALVTNYKTSLVKVLGDTADTTVVVEITAENIIALINDLPLATTVTSNDKTAINLAKASYEELAEVEKLKVTNYQKLLDCLAALEALPQSKEILTFPSASGDNEFFTVSGNIKDKPDAKTYDGVTYTTALKMESSTSIKFSTSATVTITIVTGEANKKIKINGEKYTTDANGILIVTNISSTEDIIITKGDQLNVYAIIVE